MIKFREKIFICIVIAMMVITQIPADQLIYAQSNQLFEVGVTDVDGDSKIIEVHDIEEGITKIGLFLNDKNIQTKDVSDELSFPVYANGTYEVRGFDANDAQISEESLEISSFENLSLDKNATTHEVKIVSRYDLTEKIVINKKEEVTTKETHSGYYEAYYTIPKNGEYTFDVINFDGKEVASKTMKYTDVPHVGKTGEFILSSEEDIKQINANPSGTFVLENDIVLTSDSLKDVNFSGTLEGNGYMISGFTGSLFNSVKDATINNVVMKGALANTSTNSTITNSGFYVEASDDKKDNAVILKSDNTTIKNSFALMNVEGKTLSGFILEGTGTIENSYVSGYLEGKEVYGFGKEVNIKNSYITASLVGETRTLFSNGEIEGSFYDAQINDIEESKATPIYTKDMISKDFQNEEFKIIEGQYPQIKNIEDMKEKAQAVSTLSVQSVKTGSNLSALEGKVETNEDSEEIEWDKEKEEVSAKSHDIMNRFALRSVKAITSITLGESTTAKTTQITYPITMGSYYKVLKASEASPSAPTSHKQAIESGWKIMYWSGSYKQAGLEWNTDYNVYSTNLANVTKDGTVKTNSGKLGGKITLTGTYDEGQTLTATLSGTNTTKGMMYFESASTLNASSWSTVQTTTMDGTSDYVTYQVEATLKGKYLRVRFEANQTSGYQGTIIDKTKTVFKEEITGVTIVNRTSTNGTYTLNDELVVNLTPSGKENDVVFKWYHENETESIASGRNYQIKTNDIGKKLFVRAEAKADGIFKDFKDSNLTSEVQPIKHKTPTATSQLKEVSKDDITITLTMDVAEGLYRYGYRTTGITDPITSYSVLARNKTNTTITGLKPNTSYDFYVQLVGEKGYTDSDWSTDYIAITTEKEHVKGDVVVTGDFIYNKQLSTSLINNPNGQTGQFVWYRFNDDGTKTDIATNVETYTLVKEDIGKKIEVAYEGTGSYAGEISTITDTISKEEKTAPTTNLTVSTKDDTSITVEMPTNSTSEKYILGVSQSKNGVPIERLENNIVKELSSGETYKITGLDRDTEYFLYVRYAENAIHQKSNWIDASKAVSQKTDTKTFTGSITFTYETTNLMRGQTVTAKLNPTDISFNYKGEWKWTRIEGTKETDINNFTLTNNKQGTQYVVPTDEVLDVTYKVTFTANVGYAGSVNATSTKVHDIVKEQYEKPIANDIVMEAIDDTSIKVKMDSGEGKYHFWYKQADQTLWDSIKGFFNKTFIDPNDGYREVKATTDTGVDVLANTDVVISGLDRNTEYIVKVQRVGDDKGTTSDFTYSTDKASGTSISTKKTEIAGHVTIEGTTRFNQTLTATYNKATYASTGSGSDSEGIWQWYRGTTPIASATNAKYIPVQLDIGQVLTAKYSMPSNHSFEGEVEAKTATIQKAIGVSPTITDIKSKEVNGNMTMTVTGTLGAGGTDSVYYRLQKATALAPTNVPTIGPSVPPGWHRVTNATIDINKDCDNLDLTANTEYIIYFIKTATDTEESTSMLSQSHKMGTHQQIGTITFTKPTDTTKQAFVVGQTVKADLSTGINSKGTWKWYMSTTTYDGSTITTAPSSTASASWKEITSGFSQTTDNRTSSLNLSEDMFGHFIRAEFVASNDSGYSGTISSIESQYVRKIYDEKLTITSSTKDGNGNPKAYANTVITGTIDNYAESGNLNRATVRFKVGTSTYITSSLTISNGTFKYTMNNTTSYDGQEITAEVSTPKIIGLYVDTNLKAMTTKTLNSKSSTNTSMNYTAGVPISNLTDLENFMKRASGYDDYTVNAKFVLTDDIDMSSGTYRYTDTNWHYLQGVFDGDYHIISGLNTYLFHYICSKDYHQNSVSDVGSATVRNLIILNSNVSINGSAGTLARTSVTNLTIERVMSLDSKITSAMFAGLLMGRSDTLRSDNLDYALNISEVMSAGGMIKSNNGEGNDNGGGALVGGVSIPTKISDVATVSTSVSSKYRTGGLIGNATKNAVITSPNIVTMNNVLASSTLENTVSNFGPVIGLNGNGNIIQNNVYYDSTIYSGASNGYGTGKPTNGLTGTSLSSQFGTSKWVYNSGYYPRLAWLKDNPMAKLYTATRSAFTSVDEATNATEMFNGTISGPIQIPAELQTKDFKVSSSDATILKVTDSGTIIPVGTAGQKATITITYTKPDSSVKAVVKNTFEFTVKKQVSAMSNVSIVDNTTGSTLTTAPTMNQVLSANATQGTSWQWYRRKSGSTTKETISGATAKTYTVKASDVGYEISVLVKQSGYASTYSNFTNAAVSILPSAPSVTNATDSSVIISANGNNAFKYEFGYLRADQNALITPMDGTYAYNASVAVNNLQRNKNYKFYTRIAEASDKSYPASEWSPAKTETTLKSNITGTPKLGSAINNGDKLSLNMETTNGQTGTWKLERMDANGTSKVADIVFNESNNTAEYTLTATDVRNRIKATFTGNGDFQGSQSALSDVIQKSTTTAPSAPTAVSKTKKSIIVKMEDAGTYDIGYATSADGTKTEIEKVSGQTEVIIPDLTHNTEYYIFARKSETDASVASPWSNYLNAKTEKSVLNVQFNVKGPAKVGETITYTPVLYDENSNVVDDVIWKDSGIWKLEREARDYTKTKTTISPSDYSIIDDKLTYTVDPKDGNYNLVATLTAIGDYVGAPSKSVHIFFGEQTTENMPTGITIIDPKDYSFKVKANNGNDVYQFGYMLKGATTGPKFINSTVQAGTDVLIDGLERNKEYDIYIKKAGKTGYNESSYIQIGTYTTAKSSLTGTVEYVKVENGSEVPAKVGVAEVNATYKAKYIPGKYDQTGVDTAGHWQWYADSKPIAGATNDTYKIDPMTNVDEITVRFIADDTSDFKDYRLASIGTLTKPVYNPPTALPTVTALSEDGTTGSKLSIKSNEVDHVFYYIQKEENTSVPSTILASVAEKNEVKANQWFTATADMTLNLEANTSYVVYVARLEDGAHLSSGVISQNAVRTVKDDIRQINSISISEADTTKWKVLQDKELRINRDGASVEGVWQYYVSQTKDDANSWQNVTAEIKVNSVEGKTKDYTFTKVNVPLKYANGYYIRAVFTGRGDLEGSKTYTSNEVLIGTQIKGSAVLSTGNTSEVFVPIKANYIYAKDNGQDIIDEQNGIWTWYRETSVGSGQYEKIKRDSDTVGISDQYTPTSDDVEKKIYATYTGALDGIYSGSVTSNTLDNVKRALQETPENITLKQVSGTSVQINLPTNMKTTGKTIAQPRLEYRVEGTNTWSKNSVGDAWITGLKANTKYDVRVLFEGTSEYEPSAYGTTISITTGNQSFDEENLEITQPTILETGNEITATFSGSGYDEGYFVIKRSDGTVIQDKVQGTITKGFLFKSSSATIKYTIANDDIGSNIIIGFKANDNAETYGGSIEKSTKEVSKPINPTKAGTPTLNTVQYDETVLRVDVNDANEYVFNQSATAVSVTSGDWQKLTKDAGQTYHTFTGLDKTKEYYLHVRTAETQAYRYSKEDVSAATKPWASTQYTITYEGMDGATNGNPTNPTQYTDMDAEITLKDASKNGYTFTGWTTDKITTPTKGIKIPAHSTENMTFTANWTINTYDITYSGGGTSSPTNPTTYTVETDEFTLTNPTKEGYTFTGWTYSGETSPQMSVTIPKGTFGNKAYTANWKVIEYGIAYKLDGGTNHASNPNKYTIESNAITLGEPTKKGYTFVGWSGTGITGTSKDVTITKGTIGEKEYTANWKITIYDIVYNLDNGSLIGTNPVQYNVETEDFTLENPTRKGYTFTGWSGTDITDKLETVKISKGTVGDKSFTANWKMTTYSIKYDLDNGSLVGTNPVEYTVETADFTLVNPTRKGYTFDGWSGTDIINKLETVKISKGTTGNKSYKANWKINQYTVTYDSKNGSSVNPETVDYDTLLTKPTDPIRIGYRFGGWYKEETYTTQWDFTNDKIADQHITLYAKWDQIYQLSFDKNTGEGQMNNVEFILSDSITLPKNTFTKDGFAFTGWNTQADGKGTSYDDEAVLDKVLSTNTILYATWKTQAPSVFVDIPKGLSLIDDKASKTAIKEDEVKIVKNVEDVNWYPDEDIQIRTSASITLSSDDGSHSYDVEVFKADGTKYTNPTLPLAVLNVKDDARQSVKFTLKTPMNYSKPKGIYKGSMNFIIEFIPKP